MGLRQLGWSLLVVGVLAFAGTAKADTVTVNGSYSFASHGYGIPPYGGTLNGQSESFYCVDFSSSISAGDSWNVTISSLSGLNLASTKLWSTLGSGTQTAYLEMAYLITQMMSISQKMDPASLLLKAEDQYAIWSLTGGPDPYGTNSATIAAALAAVQAGFNGQGFEILTPMGRTGQEFIIKTPEPSVLLLLVIGIMALGLMFRKNQIA